MRGYCPENQSLNTSEIDIELYLDDTDAMEPIFGGISLEDIAVVDAQERGTAPNRR